MLRGRVALVTGAGRGLGRAHALALAAHGAAVVINDLDAGPAAEVAGEVCARGGQAIADHTDVASIRGGRQAVQTAIDSFGRIDVLVNNAGFAHGGGTVEVPDDDGLDALLAVHFKAAVGTMAAAFPDMRTRGWGRIVNTVSEASLDPRFVASVGYGAAKAALWSATLVAAAQWETHGITVNAISPGAARASTPTCSTPASGTAHRPTSISTRPTSPPSSPTWHRRTPATSPAGSSTPPAATCASTRRRGRRSPSSPDACTRRLTVQPGEPSMARSSCFLTLPDAVSGRLAMAIQRRGTLNDARCSRPNRSRSPASTSAPVTTR